MALLTLIHSLDIQKRLEGRHSVDQKEFNELHADCVSAFKNYATEAEITATMLANCTAEPMPLPDRLKVMVQESIENTAHTLYLGAKRLLHEAARLGYAFTVQKESSRVGSRL